MAKAQLHFYGPTHSRINRMTGRWRDIYSLATADTPMWGFKTQCITEAKERGMVAVFHERKADALAAVEGNIMGDIVAATIGAQ